MSNIKTPESNVEAKKADAASVSADALVTNEEPPKMAELQGIRYTGMSDERHITTKDLESLGIENPKRDLSWTKANSHFIPASEINAATRDWLVSQSDFTAE